jgi:tight adherence protein B
MDNFLPIVLFIAVLTSVEIGYFTLRNFRFSERKEIRRRLRVLSFPEEGSGPVNILRKNVLSEIPWLDKFLKKMALMEKMTRLVEQAGARRTPGFYFLMSLTLAFVGGIAGSKVHSAFFPLMPGFITVLPFLAVFALLPLLHLRRSRKKRFQKFEAQLPEALDLIARSLKAGHAFSSGLKLVSEEMEDPVRSEFERTLNEINFGVSVPEALMNFSGRVHVEDLRFFVISVLLQRETGGNLAEILENLSYLIREKFKLDGKVRVLSAQAKMSAYVLVAIPFVLAFIINLLNPTFFQPMLENPSGRYLLGFGVLWMIVGCFAMKKMVAIRV